MPSHPKKSKSRVRLERHMPNHPKKSSQPKKSRVKLHRLPSSLQQMLGRQRRSRDNPNNPMTLNRLPPELIRLMMERERNTAPFAYVVPFKNFNHQTSDMKSGFRIRPSRNQKLGGYLTPKFNKPSLQSLREREFKTIGNAMQAVNTQLRPYVNNIRIIPRPSSGIIELHAGQALHPHPNRARISGYRLKAPNQMVPLRKTHPSGRGLLSQTSKMFAREGRSELDALLEHVEAQEERASLARKYRNLRQRLKAQGKLRNFQTLQSLFGSEAYYQLNRSNRDLVLKALHASD